MKLEIVAVGKLKNRHFRALADDYLERLQRYVPVDEIEVSSGGGAAAEADALERAASEGAVTVALDERGKEVTSRKLAGWVDRWMVDGRRYVSFFVGGAAGLDADFRRRCDRRLALSKLTFPHQMARMVLAEQLYRAMSIIRGEPYHK